MNTDNITTPYKTERLEARISTDQKKLFQHAANLLGRSLTDFMISSLQETAKQVIEEHEVIHLHADDRKAFVQALLHPPKPNKALINAAKRHRKRVSSDLH